MTAITSTPAGSVCLLGVRIDRVRLVDLLEQVVRSIRSGNPQTILYVNAHCMNVQYRDRTYQDILAGADTVYCDGAGVVLAARLTGQTIPERMTGADWIEDLCRTAVDQDLSLALLGGAPEAVHGAAAVLRRRYPTLRIVGEHDGYAVGAGAIRAINAQAPDILLVGMGTPRQEKWIAAHRGALDAGWSGRWGASLTSSAAVSHAVPPG